MNNIPDKDTIQLFRNTFTSPEGRKVFRHLLVELGMFAPAAADDVEAHALKEFGFRLMELTGIWSEANCSNVVDGLMRVPSIDLYLGKEEGKRQEA